MWKYHKANGFSASKDHRQEVTVIEFQEAILACKTPKKTTSSRLEWKKVGQGVSLVYYQQALQGDFKDRAEMIDFNIRIKNVTRSDAGEYRCEVSAPTEQGQNLQEDTVMLEVLVAPAVPACEVPTSVMTGSVVELRCQDKEGNPAPEYIWFKDGTSLLGNPKGGTHNNSSYTMNTKSGILQFNMISKMDSGEYYCEARNSVGHRRCPGKRMQVDVLNISGIIATVVVVAFVISVCGLSTCYAQRKGYFSSTVSPMKFYHQLWRECFYGCCATTFTMTCICAVIHLSNQITRPFCEILELYGMCERHPESIAAQRHSV